MGIKINDNRNSNDIVRSGDIVIVDGEYYLARHIDCCSKLVFFCLTDQNVWDSDGIEIDITSVSATEVKEHFHDNNIEIIPKEDYEMTINIGGAK